MTASLPVQGLTMLDVTVQSVDGNLASVRANQAGGRTFIVRRDFMRAKGELPYPGERWIVDRSFGNDWSFAMIISESMTPPPPPPRAPLLVVPNLAARNAITDLTPGQIVRRADSGSQDIWDGTIWRGMKPMWYPQIRPTLLGWTSSQSTASATAYTVARADLDDPGWPYYISAGAGMLISVSDSTSGFSHNAALVIDSQVLPSVAAPSVVSYNYLGAAQGGFGNLQLPFGKSENIWTGSHSVYFLFRNGAAGTCSFGPLQTAVHYHFDVQITPV